MLQQREQAASERLEERLQPAGGHPRLVAQQQGIVGMLGIADGVGHAALEIEHLLQVRREAGEIVGGLGLGPRLLGDGLQLGDGGHQVGGDAAGDVVRLACLIHGPHAIRIRCFAGDLGLGGGDQAARLIGREALLRDARHRGELVARASSRRRAASASGRPT